MKERRIGIMGGTFNPIHNAHLLLAESAREQFLLDRIIFIPAGIPYLKIDEEKYKNMVPSGDLRYQMTKIATKSNPYFTCSRIEIDREGNTYTADTLIELEKLYPGYELYFIMGADSLMTMEKWYHIEDIFSACVIIAAVRDHVDEKALKEKADMLKEKYGARIELLETGRYDVSSTDIRMRLLEGKSVRYMLPEECVDFIRTRNLYSGNADNTNIQSKVYVPKTRK